MARHKKCIESITWGVCVEFGASRKKTINLKERKAFESFLRNRVREYFRARTYVTFETIDHHWVGSY